MSRTYFGCLLIAFVLRVTAAMAETPTAGDDSKTVAPTAPPNKPWVEWKKFADPKTGHEVWQLSTLGGTSVAPYFENQAFTPDDRYVVFATNRWGEWRLVRVELATGQSQVMPDVSGDLGSTVAWSIRPGTYDLYWPQDAALNKTDVRTFKTQRVIDLAGKIPGAIRWSQSYTSDGAFTVVTASTGSQAETLFYQVNLKTGEAKQVQKWPGILSHPLICPTDPNLITFVPLPDTQNDMKLPMEKRARNWIIDCNAGTSKPFLTCPYGFRATHETWSFDGKRFFFFEKTEPGWVPTSICSIDCDGGNWNKYFTSRVFLGHGVSSTDARWFIADAESPSENPLILIDLITGRSETICWPNSSITGGHPKHAHVHPSLSFSGKYATYTSDVTGTPQAYVAPLDGILKKLSAPSGQ